MKFNDGLSVRLLNTALLLTRIRKEHFIVPFLRNRRGVILGIVLSTILVNVPLLASASPIYVPGVGEINSKSSNGLRIIVTVNSPYNAGKVKIQVTGPLGDYMYRVYNLPGQDSVSTKFLFYPGLIPPGSKFKACATRISTQQTQCVTGVNGPEKEPEFLYITVPGGRTPSGGTGSGEINWENLCVQYHSLIGVTEQRCHVLAQGTTITSAGTGFLICSLVTKVGPAALGLPDILTLIPC